MRQAARADPATLPAAANTGALHRRRGHAITGKLVVKVLKGLPMSTRKVLAAIARAGNNNPRVIRGVLRNLLHISTAGRKPKDGNYIGPLDRARSLTGSSPAA